MAPETKSKKRKSVGSTEEVEKAKKVKKTSEVLPKKRKAVEVAEPLPATKSSKRAKQPASEEEPKVPAKEDDFEAFDDDDEDEEEDSEIDDQTSALLQGFESDNDDESSEPSKGPGYKPGDPLPTLSKKAQKKAAAAAASKPSDTPGTVYIGHLPHGFYESELRGYFSQFGDITRLRVSRNRRTGASKHFAFIEFASAEVASIVAQTMNNYLMFQRLLRVKVVPPEQVHEDLWKGANKRFKKVPWNKLAGRKLNEKAGEGRWRERIEREERRRREKKEKLRALGVEYEFVAPGLKGVEDVVRGEQEVKAIEAPKDVEDASVEKVEEAPAPVKGGKKKARKSKA